MSSPSESGALRTLLTVAFRPFFLAAALWGAIAVGLWIAMLTIGLRLPSRLDPLDWHIHAMLFGFAPAAVAGFLLTAIANWTGRPPVSGVRLGLLAGLWLLGRLDELLSALWPAWLAIAADLAFPLALAAVVAHELIVTRNRRNYPMIVPILVISIAQWLMDLGVQGGDGALTGYGWRLGLVALLILISVVGGRIVPSFTHNWLLGRSSDRLPPPVGGLDRASPVVLHTALVGWVFFPAARPIGMALLVGAALTLWRLLRWRGAATRSEPLLLILHVGYLWLALGVAALAAANLDSAFALGAAIHALTVGAIGTMILAVMTRVSRGHTGRTLAADGPSVLIYALVVLAAAARIAAAFAIAARQSLLVSAAALWVGAFGLFLVRYAPVLLRPRGSAERTASPAAPAVSIASSRH